MTLSAARNKKICGEFTVSVSGSSADLTLEDFVGIFGDRRVLVIGVFASTETANDTDDSGRFWTKNKEDLLDFVVERDFFRLRTSSENNNNYIQGFFDSRLNRVYMNLVSKEVDDVERESRRLFQHSKLILWSLFQCHVLIAHHPSCNVDLDHIHLFQALEAARTKLGANFSDALKRLDVGLSKEWVLLGRKTPPRLVFYFASAPPGNIHTCKCIFTCSASSEQQGMESCCSSCYSKNS